MLTEAKFSQVMDDLSRFGVKGHERLVVQDGLLKTKSKGNWLQRIIHYFYKPKNERIQTISQFALRFFQEHKAYIQDPDILQRLVPTLQKANHGSKLEELILQINEKSTAEESVPDKQELQAEIMEEALESVKRVLHPSIQRAALVKFALKQVKLDPAKALEIVNELLPLRLDADILVECVQVYIAVADEQLKDDREAAIETLQQAFQIARRITIRYNQVQALSKIAVQLHQIDPDEANQIIIKASEIADGIPYHLWREKALAALATEQAKIDLQEGLQQAREINESTFRELALAEIVVELAKEDLQEAFETVGGLRNMEHRAMALSNIAREQAIEDPEGACETIREALAFARELDVGYTRASVTAYIGREQVKLDPEEAFETIKEALEVASSILDGLYPLAEALPLYAKYDLDEALKIAREIEDSYYRARALAGIAVEMTQ